MKIESPVGATPIDPDTLAGLIPNLTLQRELDEFEANNIAKAVLWAERSRKLKKELLTANGLSLLHQRMFDDTWTWSGQWRTRQTNIGVSPGSILNQLGILLGDVKYWIENKTYEPREIAVRFHHLLVQIHPFPNGNGRFSRLAADLLLKRLGGEPLSWGSQSLKPGEMREKYLRALRVADREFSYEELLEFART